MPAANFIPVEFVDAVQKYLKSFGNAILAQANDESFKGAKVASPDDLVSRWFDFSVWDKRAENTILPFIRASILIAGPQALKDVAPDAQFDSSNPGVQKALNERSVVIRGMNRTIQKDTRAAIATGIDAGENSSQVRKRIEGVFGFTNKDRATRIARTETIWALNEGAVQGYKQSGVVIAKEWSTAQDERVCQWCGPMDGKIIGLEGDYFKMGDQFVGRDGGVLNFQIENVGHPPLHPQCRCAIVPVVREV
jgi:SPP1 gp7 family putative phage head morphogenesis protein